jgi:hypothetical protein
MLPEGRLCKLIASYSKVNSKITQTATIATREDKTEM